VIVTNCCSVERDKVTWGHQTASRPSDRWSSYCILPLVNTVTSWTVGFAGNSIQLQGPDYTQTYGFPPEPPNSVGSGHIIFKIDSNTNDQDYTLSFNINGSNWALYSCEVTNL
jgi:hypothetical protein